MEQSANVEATSESAFQCPVSIGKGIYLSAGRGTLTIDQGELTLSKRDGSVIAKGATTNVWVAKSIDSLKLWVGDERFILRPGKGVDVRVPGHLTAAYGARVAAKQYTQFKAFADLILAVADDVGAHIGKPD